MIRCRLVKGDLPPEAARDLMRRHVNDVTLRIEDADDALRKLESLKAAGAEIENLTVGQPDLEDVFLAVTGGEA